MELFAENSPETCSTLGLECGSCIHQAAANVARICHGLESSGIQQLFVQLYPSSGCRPMASAFELEYRESSDTHPPLLTFASAAA
jgi:hypothetical protein